MGSATFNKKTKSAMIGEWHIVEPCSSIQEMVHVARASYSTSPFSSELNWPDHRFYTK